MSDAAARILVVDDVEANRYTLLRRLRREGYSRVTLAENGATALELLSAREFDLVLLDIMMPEMDGYEVLGRLRGEGRLAGLPVIVISAIDDIEAAVRCIELGAEDYLPKPFNPTLLRARIGAALEKKRLRDEVSRQLAVIREVFGKYVPASVAARIVAERGNLAPVQTQATVLYTDIEDFTRIAETMAPERVVRMLNEYFDAVIAPVERHGGVVNQFQGDAMLITFNVPVPDPEHADNALRVAIEIQQATLGRRFAGRSLATRIGINTGTLIAGNVGSGGRYSYTVHGDAVNLAARLEQLNKEHGTRVLVSASTAALLRGSYRLRSIGAAAVRGKSGSVDVLALDVACPPAPTLAPERQRG